MAIPQSNPGPKKKPPPKKAPPKKQPPRGSHPSGPKAQPGKTNKPNPPKPAPPKKASPKKPPPKKPPAKKPPPKRAPPKKPPTGTRPAPKGDPVGTTPPKAKEQPSHVRTGSAGRVFKPNPTVVKAQRKIRAAGNKAIKVDGKLGPRTQRALALERRNRRQESAQPLRTSSKLAQIDKDVNDFWRQVNPVGSNEWRWTRKSLNGRDRNLPSPTRIDPFLFRNARHTTGLRDDPQRVAQIRLQRFIEQQARPRQKARQHREAAAEAAGWFRITLFKDAENAAKASPKALRQYLFDPEFGVWTPRPGETVEQLGLRIATDKHNTTMLQSWLRSHGHGKLRITGRFDDATSQALRQEMRELARVERRQRVAALVKTFWDTGVIRPKGARDPQRVKVAGMTLDLDTLTPGRLFSILEAGGLLAEQLLTTLMKRLELRSATLAYTLAQQSVAHAGVRRDSLDLAKLIEANKDEDRPFWSDAIHAVGDGLKSGFNWTVDKFEYLADALQSGFVAHGNQLMMGGGTIAGALAGHSSAAAYQASFEQARETVERFEREHPIWAMVVDFVADPTMLIPGRAFIAPFRLASSAARKTAETGWKLTSKGDGVLSLPTRLLGDSLTVPYRAGQRTALALDDVWRSVSEVLGNTRVARGAVAAARRATRLKSDVLSDARSQAHSAVLAVSDELPRPTRPSQFRQPKVKVDEKSVLREHAQTVDEHVYRHFGAVIEELRSAGASLYADIAKLELSHVGAHVYARMVNRLKANVIHDVAAQAAEAVWRAWDNGEALVGKTADEVAAEADRAYQAVVDEAPLHLAGVGGEHYAELIFRQVAERAQWLRDQVLPRLQRLLEQGRPPNTFWDELGNWVDRQGEYVQRLLAEGRRLFGDEPVPVRNPRFGQVYDTPTMERLADAEITARVARIGDQKRVFRAAGDERPDAYWAELMRAVERDVRSHWDEIAPDRWTDTREFLSVPREYAAHLVEAASGPTPDAPLAALGEATDTLMGLTPVTRISAGRYARAVNDALTAEAEAFFRALRERQQILDQVRQRELISALTSSRAIWQALRHAQGRPYRLVYTGLAAGMGTWRFLTLPLRPGWVVRNVVDNFVKVLLQGVIDPRAWFFELAERGGPRSIFEAGIPEMRAAVDLLDGLQGTRVGAFFRAAERLWWSQPLHIKQRVFAAYDIPVSGRFLELYEDTTTLAREGDNLLARWHPIRRGKVIPARADLIVDPAERRLARERGVDPSRAQRLSATIARFHDNVWHLFGSRPENYAKRVLYRHTFAKVYKQTGDIEVATERAWQKVEATLFDYSKITVAEDNLRIFFPFIQFWRKNFTFWVKTFADKPWFLSDIAEFERDLEEINLDLPPWLRRYVPLKQLSDIVERIPGLRWLAPHLENARIDPLNQLSFAPLYRSFKGENPLLPPERAGIRFLSGFVDALNEWGLSMNPFLRKILEAAGVLNLRAWQTIFPQTSLIEAFTRKYLHERFPNGLNLENWLLDPVFEALAGESLSEFSEQSFLRYVQMEMAGQALRGEPIDRAAAEEKIRDFLWAQSLLGYFVGTYVRRMTPEDIYYSQLMYGMAADAIEFNQLDPELRSLYRLWQQRGFDSVQYDRYVESLPMIRAYYQMSYLEGQDFLRAHPELLPFVEERLGNRGFGELPGWASQVQLQAQTEETFRLFDLIERVDLDRDLENLAFGILATPELRRYWSGNNTPHDLRLRQLRGQYYAHLHRLQRTYQAIPDSDWEARQGFLADHPELARFWQHTAEASNDLRTIYYSAASALRARYFEYLEHGDFDGAIGFLKRFPWIFDPTRRASKYREIVRVGHYPGYVPGGFARGSYSPGALSQHAQDYRKAKRWLDYYFDLPEGKRDDWLRGGSSGAAMVRWYFQKYSDHDGPKSQKAKDYLRAKKWLDHYFSMGKEARAKWLQGNSKGARIVRRYFDKYVDPPEPSQKQRDYLRAKPHLEYYFSLPEDQRAAWLKSDAPGAAIVRRYFEKYAEQKPQSQHAKDYLAVKDDLAYYWRLPDEQRAAWLSSGDPRAQRVKAYFEKYADPQGESQRARDYRAIKPILDQYFALPAGPQRRAFLDAHPELRDYFAKYSQTQKIERSFAWNEEIERISRTYGVRRRGGFKGRDGDRRPFRRRHLDAMDPKLRRRLRFWELYFSLPPDERPRFVAEHAEEYGVFVYGPLGEQEAADKQQDWMREGFRWAEESERSQLYAQIAPLIDFYFSLDDSAERDLLLRANPELQRYFELANDGPSTGDPALDELLEQYFRLPRGSRQRAMLLQEHPELQAWFDDNSTPEDKALHDALEVYFSLSTRERKRYLIEHPEIQEYFDKRRRERANERAQLEAFDRADPRLAPFREAAEAEIVQAALLKKKQLAIAAARPILLEARRRRREARDDVRRQFVLG